MTNDEGYMANDVGWMTHDKAWMTNAEQWIECLLQGNYDNNTVLWIVG